jgi:hypothetical protein
MIIPTITRQQRSPPRPRRGPRQKTTNCPYPISSPTAVHSATNTYSTKSAPLRKTSWAITRATPPLMDKDYARNQGARPHQARQRRQYGFQPQSSSMPQPCAHEVPPGNHSDKQYKLRRHRLWQRPGTEKQPQRQAAYEHRRYADGERQATTPRGFHQAKTAHNQHRQNRKKLRPSMSNLAPLPE